jgi:hypothetical protein
MKCSTSLRSFLLISSSVTLCILTGCSDSFNVPDTGATGASQTIKGTVYGGHAPLVNAHVYMFQTGSGSLGAASKSLLGYTTGGPTSPYFPLQTDISDPHITLGWKYVLTDVNGSFELTNQYKCSSGTPVYLYAYGGTPGGIAGNPAGFNTSVVNLATLGNCPSGQVEFPNSIFVSMNEVSTVATAFAFQGFTSASNNDALHIGFDGTTSSSQGLTGIENAALNTEQIYDIAGSVAGRGANYYTEGASGPNLGTGIVPTAVINTLGNILAACVDSSSSSACTALFATATADGTTTGTKPTDTATAAINIARHPAGVSNTSYATNLFNIPTGAVPFSPNLATAPPDFTIALQFPSSTNSLFYGARSVSVDGSGDFFFDTWVTPPNAYATPQVYGSSYLAVASPLGIIQNTSGSSATSNALGNMAVDSSGNAWVGTVDVSLGPYYELGAGIFGTFNEYSIGFTAAAAPVADNSTSDGLLYITHGPTCTLPPSSCGGTNDDNPTLTVVNPNGTTGASYLLTATFGAAAFPTHAAIDSAGDIWYTSDTPTYGNTITRVVKGSGLVTSSKFPISPVNPINSLPPSSSVPTNLTCGTTWLSPEQPAIDYYGNAWIPINATTSGAGTGVFFINAAGTTCTAYSTANGGAAGAPYGAAVDGANHVWITNTTGGVAGTGSLAELSAATGTLGTPLSSTNFQPVSSTGSSLLNDPLNVAVDISGDVLVTNYTGNSVVEFIGLGTPLYGPLGVAAGTTTCGGTPYACKIGVAP